MSSVRTGAGSLGAKLRSQKFLTPSSPPPSREDEAPDTKWRRLGVNHPDGTTEQPRLLPRRK